MDFLKFAVDWNAGLTAKKLAVKYGIDVATVRNYVSALRNKGVNLEKRVKSHLDIDVKAINDGLIKAEKGKLA